MNHYPAVTRAIVWLGVGLMGMGSLWAEPVARERAQHVAARWLAQEARPLGAPLGAPSGAAETYYHTNQAALYHVIYLQPSGFIIVAAEDRLEPIVAFAPRGRFDASERHPLGALLRRDLAARLAALRDNGPALAGGVPTRVRAAHQWNQTKWQQLDPVSSGEGQAKYIVTVSDERVAPLLQSAWDQSDDSGGDCYNYYTPNHDPCGCGATAMAQLMRYHQHPTAGVGARSSEIEVNGVSQTHVLLGGDGAGGPYVWSAMPLDPDNTITETQRQAIGALCHDAAVAAHASFTETATSTSLLDMSEVLKSVFGYAQLIQGMAADGGNIGSGLTGMLNPGLDAGYPGLLGIYGEQGGHAVVCDGYGYNGGTLYHHLNLGWGASITVDNAWYALPLVDALGITFTTVNFCMYNLFPGGSGEIVSGRILDASGNPLSGATITATRAGGGTYTAASNSRGIFALAGVPASSTYTLTVSLQGYVFGERSVSVGASTDYESASGSQWGVDFTGNADLDAPPQYAPASADYDGDGEADPALYQDATGYWGVWLTGQGGALSAFAFGAAGCVPASGDYDGDGLADPALYQASSGYIGVWSSRSGALDLYALAADCTVVSADYDGDGLLDPAVYQEASGYWGVLQSSQGHALRLYACGGAGCAPAPADYDGDGLTDPAVYQDSSGYWGILLSASGYATAMLQFGATGCEPVAADYDGDGLADPALYQESTGYWGLLLSKSGYALTLATLGGPRCFTAPVDYDGDGWSDPAVYKEASERWDYLLSAQGTAPTVPADVAASDGAYTNQVSVTWQSADGAKQYLIWRATTNAQSAAERIGAGTDTRYADTNAEAGRLYYYWVQATNRFGVSAAGGSDTGFCLVASLAAPTGLAASDGIFTNKVRLTWSAVSGAAAYRVWRGTDAAAGSAAALSETDGTNVYDTTLTVNATNYYWVQALALGGVTSAFSAGDSGYAAAAAGATSADLGVTNLVFYPDLISPGGHPVYVTVSLKNNGPTRVASTNAAVAVDFYLSTNTICGDGDDLALGSYTTATTVSSGSSTTLTLSSSARDALTVPDEAEGLYYVFSRVRFAVGSALTDPNDDNNATPRSGTISVRSGSWGLR